MMVDVRNMKRPFVAIILYGLCAVLLLVLQQQYTNVGIFVRQDERTAPTSYNQNLLDPTLTIPDHRLPAKIEDLIASVLNRSLSHRSTRRSKKGEALEVFLGTNSTPGQIQPWQQFINHIHRHEIYSEDDPVLDEVIHRMKGLKIAEINESSKGGTEFKFYLTLADGTPIIAKPMRLKINNEPPPRMSKNSFYERFQSEVAAYHLSRVLKFHLVPPATSRYVNLSSEIYQLTKGSLKETFFKNSKGDTCLTGNCHKKCSRQHAICGQPDVIPVSFALFIPKLLFDAWVRNPVYGRIAPKHRTPQYCDKLKKHTDSISSAARTHLDIVDINVFDYIQGNLDRHHYGQIKHFGRDSSPWLFDNGRGFARSYQDDYDLLYPLVKCCQIRLSTFEKLMNAYQKEGRLSGAMQRAIQTEIVQPLLTDEQLAALDRRMVKVLEAIYGCLRNTGEKTIIDDGY